MLTRAGTAAVLGGSKVALSRYNRRAGRFVVVPGTVRPAVSPTKWTITRPGTYKTVLLGRGGLVATLGVHSMPAEAGDTIRLVYPS